MEAVFAVLSGFFLLDERLTSREILGCLFMFIGILLPQIDTLYFTKDTSDSNKIA